MNSEKKIKILYITVRADFGGGPEHLYRLLTGLPDKYETYVAAPDDYPYYERYTRLAGKEKIITIPHRKFTLGYLFKLVKYIRKNEISIVHSMGKGAGIYGRPAAFLASCFAVHTFHGIHIGAYNFIRKKLYLLIERILSAFTSAAISVSENERKVILENKIINDGKLVVVNNGVVIGEKPDSKDIESSEVIKIVTITRFDYQKNSKLLIPVINELRKFTEKKIELTLLGTGDEYEEVKGLAKKNNLIGEFIFKGAVTDPVEQMKQAHVFISTSRWEGLPIALLEAMSVGLPVVATEVVGNKDIVRDGYNGYLYQEDKPEDAARRIIDMMNNNKWNALSANAYDTVKNKFSIASMITDTEKVYAKIMGGEV